MAARFILIDPSIAGFAGHHLEYANQVLRAAGQAGYLPVLAANRRLAPQESDSFATHRVYKYGFWTRPLAVGHFSPLRGPYQLVRRFAGNQRIGAWGAGVPPAHEAQPGRLHHRVARLNINHWFARAISQGACCWKRRISDPIRARQFERDTANLLRQLAVSRGDVVFLPTMGEIELAGLVRALGRVQGCQEAQWHLAFRRDPPDSHDSGALRQLARALKQACAACGGNIHFFTDTEELSRQYQELTTVPFQTLPIPHTDGLVPTDTPATRPCHPAPGDSGGRSSRPQDAGTLPALHLAGRLRILYLGDARREKGYHHLPAVIEDLSTQYVATGRIAFTIQSNLTADEPEVRAARSRLHAMASDAVTILDSALSSAEYHRLLLSGDIVLLLYDRAAYRSRSSGILVEALAAGIPAIVPAGTWLARQFPTQEDGQRWSAAEAAQRSLGPVGLSYGDVREVPALVREMIAHYDDYRRSAQAFGAGWVKRHNAARLIEMLAP